MNIQIFIFLLLGFVASLIGAIPFGLVNLSVLQTALNKGAKAAIPVSYGASVVEVGYGILGIFAGSLISRHIDNNPWFSIFTASALLMIGLAFIFRKSHFEFNKNNTLGGFFYGVLLNLLSLQVLAYWILAISFITALNIQIFSPTSVFLFLLGIWIGKMGVLVSYASWGSKIVQRSEKISQNINRFIGIVLIGLSAYSLVKILL